MLYWNTGDRVVDCILTKMEGLSTWRDNAGPEEVHQLLGGIINIEKMLPKAVAKHFKIPNPYVGGSHFDLGDDYRKRLVTGMTTALKEGLQRAAADPALKRDGGADFSDRPRSRGEEIIEAVEAFENEQTQANLSKLRMSISQTNLHYRVQTIEKMFGRTRPIGNQDPKVAMYGELYRLRSEAEGYHGTCAK